MRIIETSNGLMAQIVFNSKYDGHWVSSLCHSTWRGLPDNELIPLSDRVDVVREIRRISTKPIVVDIDTGGDIEHIETITKWFREAGADYLVMEDKRFPKQNSLLEEGKKDLEDVDVFSEKIKKAKVGGIKIIARLESLIAKKSKYEAVLRARAYIEAGADGIMVHSKVKVDPTEVMEVGNELRKLYPDIILVAVPTTYNLPEKHPFDIVIEANQMTRACLRVMNDLVDGEIVHLASVEEIFDLCGK